MTAKKKTEEEKKKPSRGAATRSQTPDVKRPDDETFRARRIMSATPVKGALNVVSPSVARLPKEELKKLPLRQRLVLAAIDEVEEVGFERFSMRRVATACGASCAAPYKHFKNRREIFVAVFEYVADVWLERQEKTLKRLADEPLRVQLVELALDYIRFLVENPRLRAILMVDDQPRDGIFLHVKARISDRSKELIIQFCAEQKIDLRVARVKMYVVRSYIYGFALMFCNNELPYNDNMTRFIRALIQREIDLPWTAGFTEEDLSRGAELIEFLAKLGPDVSELRQELKPEPKNFPID